MEHSNFKREIKPVLDTNTLSGALMWIYVLTTFAVCCGVGLWTGYSSYLLNTFIVGFGFYNVFQLGNWLTRLRHHIARSDQILCSSLTLTPNAILGRQEVDHPIALTILQAMCVKAIRGRGAGHEAVLRSMERSLLDELTPFVVAAMALPAMGLIGTCIGMMGTLNAISAGAADVTDLDAVSQAVGGSLPSMSVAISTTLAAAFVGSLVLMGLIIIAKSKLYKFIDQLDVQLDMFPIRLEDKQEDFNDE